TLIRGDDPGRLLSSPWFAEQLPMPDSALWWPARAVMGTLPWTPLAAAGCLGLFGGTVLSLAEPFTRGLAATAGTASSPKRRATTTLPRFHTGTRYALVRKELRLVFRDPW